MPRVSGPNPRRRRGYQISIAAQAEELSALDYFALLLNKRDAIIGYNALGTGVMPQNAAEMARTEFQKYAAEPITEQLASLTKLKHVSDQLEAWKLDTTPWVVAIADERKKEIREGRTTRQVNRDGVQKTRFAPKAEFTAWQKALWEWKRTPDVSRTGDKPKISEKAEAFILSSTSVEPNEVAEYFEFIDTPSPAYQTWVLARNDWHHAVTYLKKVKTIS